jgi:hypothetical protein
MHFMGGQKGAYMARAISAATAALASQKSTAVMLEPCRRGKKSVRIAAAAAATKLLV